MDEENNSFGMLRLIFAVAVLYFHSFILGGFGEEPFGILLSKQESVGSIAVMGFFVVSGFLITKSVSSSKSLIVYAYHRCLRILPGFWACLMVTAFIFAPVVHFIERRTLNGFFYLNPSGPFKYITTNFFLLMHQYSIGNLLNQNPLKHIFNGSLWTLFPEAKAYVFIGFLGLLRLHKSKLTLITTFFLLWSLILLDVNIQSSPNKYLRLVVDPTFLLYGTYFIAGSVAYLIKDRIPLNKTVFSLAMTLLVISSNMGYLHKTLPILGSYVVLWLSQKLPYKNFGRKTDLSYGIYIYAFPVQQILSLVNMNKNFLIYFSFTLLVTSIFAYLSWKCIEQPAINLKRLKFSFTNHTIQI